MAVSADLRPNFRMPSVLPQIPKGGFKGDNGSNLFSETPGTQSFQLLQWVDLQRKLDNSLRTINLSTTINLANSSSGFSVNSLIKDNGVLEGASFLTPYHRGQLDLTEIHLIRDIYGSHAVFAVDLQAGAEEQKFVRAVLLATGEWKILKEGSRRAIIGEKEGDRLLEGTRMAEHFPSLEYWVLIGERGYILYEMVPEYKDQKSRLKDGDLTIGETLTFLDHHFGIHEEVWDKNPPKYNLIFNYDDPQSYSMQRREFAMAKSGGYSKLVFLLSRMKKIDPTLSIDITTLSKACLEVRVFNEESGIFEWKTYPSFFSIEERLEEENKKPVFCVVPANGDGSLKNVLITPKGKIYYVDKEMSAEQTDLAENISVLDSSGKSPAMANFIEMELYYDKKKNTFVLPYFDIGYSPQALAAHNYILGQLPRLSEKYKYPNLSSNFSVRVADREMYRLGHLSSGIMRSNPELLICYLLEAGMALEKADKLASGEKRSRRAVYQ